MKAGMRRQREEEEEKKKIKTPTPAPLVTQKPTVRWADEPSLADEGSVEGSGSVGNDLSSCSSLRMDSLSITNSYTGGVDSHLDAFILRNKASRFQNTDGEDDSVIFGGGGSDNEGKTSSGSSQDCRPASAGKEHYLKTKELRSASLSPTPGNVTAVVRDGKTAQGKKAEAAKFLAQRGHQGRLQQRLASDASFAADRQGGEEYEGHLAGKYEAFNYLKHQAVRAWASVGLRKAAREELEECLVAHMRVRDENFLWLSQQANRWMN